MRFEKHQLTLRCPYLFSSYINVVETRKYIYFISFIKKSKRFKKIKEINYKILETFFNLSFFFLIYFLYK